MGLEGSIRISNLDELVADPLALSLVRHRGGGEGEVIAYVLVLKLVSKPVLSVNEPRHSFMWKVTGWRLL